MFTVAKDFSDLEGKVVRKVSYNGSDTEIITTCGTVLVFDLEDNSYEEGQHIEFAERDSILRVWTDGVGMRI